MDIYIAKKNNLNNINSRDYERSLSNELLKEAYYNKSQKQLNLENIIKSPRGKPYLLNSKIHFNISHSKEFVCCVVSDFEIGIDIEQPRKISSNKFIKKFVTQEDEHVEPIKVWNIKEAYSKYLGIGLGLDFSKISLTDIEKNSNIIVDEIYRNNQKLYISVCFNNNIDINKNLKYIWKSV